MYILDNGVHGIWIWVGRKVSLKERAEAIRNARGFVKKKHYPSHTPVVRVPEDNAPIEFKALFKSWRNSDVQAEANGDYTSFRIAHLSYLTLRKCAHV